MVVLPWGKIKNIKEFNPINELKLKHLTNTILYLSGFSFLVFLFITITLWLTFSADQINAFKYSPGTSIDFYYSLPGPIVKFFILANVLYYLSYFLIPLHFYYLAKKQYRLSIICFIFSLNIIFVGFTYFSRIGTPQYLLIYFMFYLILNKTLTSKINKKIKKTAFVLVGLSLFYFVTISVARFESDKVYENKISSNSKVQNPVLYSYLDYVSQWYDNSMVVLNSYKSETFKGQLSLKPILSPLAHYDLVNFNKDNLKLLRRKLWPNNYYTFTGLTAYSVYDYGYFLTIVFSLFYYFSIVKMRPKKNSISLNNLFLMVLLIQIPLMSIFYSQVGGIIIALLFYIPIHLYLKRKIVF